MEESNKYSYQPKTPEEEAWADEALTRYMERYKSGVLNENYDGEKYAAIVFTNEGVELSCRYNNQLVNVSAELGVRWSDLKSPEVRKLRIHTRTMEESDE